MREITIPLCCICFLISGCRNQNSQEYRKISDIGGVVLTENEIVESDQVYFLDFEKHLRNTKKDTFTINSISKDISFIPLETTDDALLSTENFKLAKFNERYYISWSLDRVIKNIMEFDSTGQFIDILIKRGQGPQELPMIVFWSLNRKTQLLSASTFYEIIFYSFENATKNKYTSGNESWYGCLLNDGTFVETTQISDRDTNKPYINFRNQAGEIIHSIYYPQKRDLAHALIEDGSWIVSSYNLFPTYTGDALFRDMFNDTIYRIRSMDDINPYIIIYNGSFTPVLEDAPNQTTRVRKMYLEKILDTNNNFFVSYSYRNEKYTAIWDKRLKSFISNIKSDNSDEQRIVSNNFNSYGFTRYRTPKGKEILIPILNYYDGNLYSVLNASEAMEFLPGIVSEDNPVLMIITIG